MAAQATMWSEPLDVRLGKTSLENDAFKLRWGILGCGKISGMWAESIAPIPGASITAVAARDRSSAEAFANKWGGAGCKAYDSYDEMVADPSVDIVYVGTNTANHKKHTLLSIAAGKHVLCEKPLAENEADAAEMHAAAEAKGVMLQDAMWSRFFPAVEHARLAVERGVIGEVRCVQSDFFDPVYCLQFAPMCFGANNKPTSIVSTRGVVSAAIAQYGDHQNGVFTFPPFDTELPEVTEIIGSEGRITLEQPGHCPTRITIRRSGKATPSRYVTNNQPPPAEFFEYPLPAALANLEFPNQGGFIYQGQAIHRCLAAGLKECPQYTKADSLHTMSLLDASRCPPKVAGA